MNVHFGMFIRALRSWIIQRPITSFLILGYATTAALAFVPKALTEPGLLPGGATPHGFLENVVGSAVPAFIVTASSAGELAYVTWRGAVSSGGCHCAGTRSVCSDRC